MDRWSRRWQSGEVNKEHVRGILDEVSARRDWPVGSAEQLSGDFYGACMNESRVNELGIAPVRTLLDEISGAIKTRADVQRVIGRLHAIGVDVGFAIVCGPGPARPDPDRRAHLRVGPWPAGSRLLPQAGRPLRRGARQVPRAPRQRCSRSPGRRRRPRMPPRRRCSSWKSALPKRRSTTSRAAIRISSDHKTRFAGLAEIAPDFDWDRYFDAARLPRNDLNVTEPKFLKAFNQELAGSADRTVAQLSGLACPEDFCRLPVRAIRRAELRLLREVPQRRDRDEAALEALRRGDRRAARRSARTRLRREAFLAGSQGAHGGHGQEHPAGDA